MLIVWLAASALATTTVLAGQLGVLLAIPATLAWRDARRARWGRAGAWLGVVFSAKLFALPILLWLVLDARRRIGAVTALATMTAVVAAGMLVFGMRAYASWLRQFEGIAWWWAGMNASIAGVAARTLAPSPLFVPIADLPGAVVPLALVTGAAAVAVSLWVAQHSDVDRALAVLWSGALLASPLGWIYYGWLAVGPGWALLSGGRLARVPVAIAGVALLVPPYLLAEMRGPWWTATVGCAYTYGLAAFWLAAILARPAASIAGGRA